MSAATVQRTQTLQTTDWVAQHKEDPQVRLVEVDVDTAAYDTGHIPGTVGWNWKTDLQRHPIRDIPTKDEWERLLSRSGISNDTNIILYGDNNNWFAAFAYWLFKLYGHDNVYLMNGGRKKWVDEGRELNSEPPANKSGNYQAKNADTSLRAFRNEVERAVGNSANAMVDVRSPGEYSGALLAPENMPQEGAQRGGHIPGAASIPWATAVAEDGTFKPTEQLQEIYGGKGINSDKEVIAYCRIGERSAHTWFALHELLGYPNVRNYDGSWTEWGSLVGAPIETGT
jgi:thiosulfate/3-mercaptopyruvate sulfurtransferase